MPTVLKVDCVKDSVPGFDILNRLLERSRRDLASFESAFPSLNGGCNLYPRIAGTYRDPKEPTVLYLLLADRGEYDSEAMKLIPWIADCRVIETDPESITNHWNLIDRFEHRRPEHLWAPQHAGE